MMPEIRHVAPDELTALLDLYAFLHDEYQPPLDGEPLQNAWTDLLGDPKIHCLVAKFDGKLIGSCILTIIPNLTRGARPYGLIENVITHPKYRKQGIGTLLLQRALEIAWEQRCYKVMLLTGSKDAAIHHFYEQAGFKKGVKTGFVAVAADGVVNGG